ncbi:hypothetical protein [Xanthomonas phage BUDD]|nr:hypothetical protein [Xanthomonas phage BUDD]
MAYVIVEHYRVGCNIVSVQGPFETKEEAVAEERRLNAAEMQQRPMLFYYTVKPLVKELVERTRGSGIDETGPEWS